MTKKLRLLVASCAAFALGVSVLVTHTTHGKDIITDAQITTIRTHCTELQASLNRLHQTDTLLRHDRGQLYRTIADKLMVPLNQRIASNQLDGDGLVSVTAKYNTTYQGFYDDYREYEQSLTDVLQIDCTKEPTRFFDAVNDARQKRTVLHKTSNQLIELATEYGTQFNAFKKAETKASQN